MLQKFGIYIILLLCINCYAQQNRDMVSTTYLMSLSKKNFDYNRKRIKITPPPITTKKSLFINTIGMDIHEFTYNQELPFSEDLTSIYTINHSFLFKHRITPAWSFNVFSLTSLLSNKPIAHTIDNFLWNGGLFVERSFSKNTLKISAGVGYFTMIGESRITPLLMIEKKIGRMFLVQIGMPKTQIQYQPHRNHLFSISGELNDFMTTLSTPVSLHSVSSTQATKAIFTSVSAGIGYAFWASRFTRLSIKGMYSVFENYELIDDDNKTLYDFDSQNSYYLTVGFHIDITRGKRSSSIK
ncbi:DUF6268 family outer membrane beta-barrel protein [Aquimarina hainanensis]|uniref:DUF6268 family outer membrane beta-barrel protein n=1 Tax=Aquimarina hainanensis TaxID=1578017 RepID=A0ABW5NF98_9FLAO